MLPAIKLAFCSGSDDLNRKLVDRMLALFPELPLYVVSEFPPHAGTWIPYYVNHTLAQNAARCRAAAAGRRIRLAGVLLVPGVPYRRMRLTALALAPVGFLAFNENLDSFMLRPRCVPAILRHAAWRVRNYLRWQLHAGGKLHTWVYRTRHPARWLVPLEYKLARGAGLLHFFRRPPVTIPGPARPAGTSVIIPSRNGRDLLAANLPAILRQLGAASEMIVVDNGSDDGSEQFLAAAHPGVQIEVSAQPLTFAGAVNRGLARARYSRVCLLNNDMAVEPGFFAALEAAFERVPELFCATAQILFPPGSRREETGKAVMVQGGPEDFPIRCEEPLAGEDGTYVLYGSGGCSLYDAGKLAALGGFNEIYEPAYVEDLDAGYRAWQRGWPTVLAAGARVEHRHRATTSRYFSAAELAAMVELNYLRFLCSAAGSRRVFRRLWNGATYRLRLLAGKEDAAAIAALSRAPSLALVPGTASTADEEEFLALTNGSVTVFPGRAARGRPVVMVVAPWPPFPLAHGAAVRMYNLMRRAADAFDQVLVMFSDRHETPPRELLEICAEVVAIRRTGSHSLPASNRPRDVEEFHSAAARAALRQTVRKWRPAVAQLELTMMAQYAADCAPARTILVEHDITFDLYEQLLGERDDWETRRQLERWRRFETRAWREVDCVVTMSERDRAVVRAARVEMLPNGVDLERFRPAGTQPEAGRLLFIGSFAHLPNLLALEFFLREVWPRLDGATLHVIAGSRHEYFLEHYRERVRVDLALPGVEVEGFVADVRPAYERAALVLAPLVASAGTNIKILEAMAMGKAIVTTPAGINGLAVEAETAVVRTGEEMAQAIRELLDDSARRRDMESRARARVEREFNWDRIAARQARLYRELMR